jgi:hypothetical protein
MASTVVAGFASVLSSGSSGFGIQILFRLMKVRSVHAISRSTDTHERAGVSMCETARSLTKLLYKPCSSARSIRGRKWENDP